MRILWSLTLGVATAGGVAGGQTPSPSAPTPAATPTPTAAATPAPPPAGPTGAPATPAAKPSKPPTPTATPTSAAARRRAAQEAEPTIVTAEAAAQLRANKSADRYGRSTDLRDVPAHRQARFFNLQAEGKFFIFVVDRSGSMDNFDRFERAKRELLRSVGGMQTGQSFFVIFYNEHATPMPGDIPRSASSPARNELAHWLNRVDAWGGTDPRSALALALAMQPDGIFLLSDGDYPTGTAAGVAALNSRHTPIHCVDLSGGAGGTDLKTIAEQSGGQYSGQRR